MNKSLTADEILTMLNRKTIILRYSELANYNKIEDILKKYGNAIILYPSKENESVGHWTCIFYSVNDNGRKVIEFFDPYGLQVDSEFNISNMSSPHHMARLLYKTKYPIEYNNFKFQKFANNVSTCGRHVVNRIIHKNLPLSKYYKLYGPAKGVDSDKLVTMLIK